MARQPGFFDVEERQREVSAKGDDPERIGALVDFAMFRAELEQPVPHADGTIGGRRPMLHPVSPGQCARSLASVSSCISRASRARKKFSPVRITAIAPSLPIASQLGAIAVERMSAASWNSSPSAR